MLIPHSVYCVAFKARPDGMSLVVFHYRSIHPIDNRLTDPEIRFPAGTSGSGEFGETSEETCVRKLKEETGLLALEAEEITKKSIKGHVKHVYLIDYDHCEGKLRQNPITIRGDWMSSPFLMAIEDIRTQIAPVHFWVFRAVLDNLREKGFVIPDTHVRRT